MWLHWERTLGALHLVSVDVPHALFPFADCVWYPFTVVNHSHEYSHKLNPMSHDSHSSSSAAVICPYFSNQSNSGPHPSFSKADIYCHRLQGSLLSLELWRSPARSCPSVAAISLLLPVLWLKHSSVVSLQWCFLPSPS